MRRNERRNEKSNNNQKTSLACLLDFEAVVNCSKCETHTITLVLVRIKCGSLLLQRERENKRSKKQQQQRTHLVFRWMGYGILECTIALHFGLFYMHCMLRALNRRFFLLLLLFLLLEVNIILSLFVHLINQTHLSFGENDNQSE